MRKRSDRYSNGNNIYYPPEFRRLALMRLEPEPEVFSAWPAVFYAGLMFAAFVIAMWIVI